VRRTLVTVVALGALSLLGAGCDGDESSTPSETARAESTAPSETERPPASGTTFAIYLVRDGRVAPVRRSTTRTAAVARAALEELVAGPTADERLDGLETGIPDGTIVLGVAHEDGTATVDLSRAFEAGGGRGSSARRVAQVVATLTQFPTIERVAFRLGGTPVETIGSVAVDPPLGRKEIEEQTQQILIESPLPDDTVSSPIRLRGTANVFEATVSLEVRDGTGTVVLEAFTTATSGSGTRGTFDTSLALPTLEGPITIVAFESSAKDGRPLHSTDVRVILVR
jgi:hypothetical protein